MIRVFACIDSEAGTLNRYVAEGKKLVTTHKAGCSEPTTFHAVLVQNFRENPPDAFKVA